VESTRIRGVHRIGTRTSPRGTPQILTTHRPRRFDEQEIVVGLALLGVAAVTTALVAAPRSREGVQQLDEAWYGLVQRTRSTVRTTMSRVLDVGFGTTSDWTARVLVTAVLVRRRRWRALAAWTSTIVLGELCIGPVKAAIDRSRPPDPLTATSDTSYPSGHAIAAATTAPGIVLALMPAGPRRERVLAAAIALAAATALSRTDLNAHWLSDCIGGFSLGTGFALVLPPALDAIAGAPYAQ
jgi:membrane-associated phospholipid phosphatase